MKRVIATIAASAAILLMTACSPAATVDQPDTRGYSEWILMDDGRVVYCYIQGGYGGVSCDWENAR